MPLPSLLAALLFAGLATELEGPELPATSLARWPEASISAPPGPRMRRERDAYFDTAIAASVALLSSVDGGQRDLMDPQTLTELGTRATTSLLSTVANVSMIRSGFTRSTLDLAARVVPRGGALVLTLRF